MDSQYMDSKSEIEEAIRRHIVDAILFGNDDRFEDTISFQESGVLDSVGFLEVITFVEERFHIQIADEELVPENFDSVDRIAEFVRAKRSTKRVCAE